MEKERIFEDMHIHYQKLTLIAEQYVKDNKNKYEDINISMVLKSMEDCNFMYPEGFGSYQLEMAIEEEIKNQLMTI